jgi:hypothetical protein
VPDWLKTPEWIILLVCVLAVAIVSALTKGILRAVFGRDWPRKRARMPWRFSLLAIAVLVGVLGFAFGTLRHSPASAALVASLLFIAWLGIVRFLELRRLLADRRKKTFDAVVGVRENPPRESAEQER